MIFVDGRQIRGSGLPHDDVQLAEQYIAHCFYAGLAERCEAPRVRAPDAHRRRAQGQRYR